MKACVRDSVAVDPLKPEICSCVSLPVTKAVSVSSEPWLLFAWK
jgi:hypothetical protein